VEKRLQIGKEGDGGVGTHRKSCEGVTSPMPNGKFGSLKNQE
jgi:hypothetical protein